MRVLGIAWERGRLARNTLLDELMMSAALLIVFTVPSGLRIGSASCTESVFPSARHPVSIRALRHPWLRLTQTQYSAL